MTRETVNRKLMTCSGLEDHIHELNFMVIESFDFEKGGGQHPNRFIKDKWNCYLFFKGNFEITYKDIGLDRQLDEKDRIINYIDADTTGYLSYTIVDENNIIIHIDSNWYPKNQMIEYEHPIWMSNMFDNRVFQVLGSDVLAQRIFVSQKRMLYVDDNVSEYVEGYSNEYKFSYCILEPNHSITFDVDNTKTIWFLGDVYTVNDGYMEYIDVILTPNPNQITVKALVDNCYIVVSEKL